jgi:hypothetical protein
MRDKFGCDIRHGHHEKGFKALLQDRMKKSAGKGPSNKGVCFVVRRPLVSTKLLP